MEMTKFKEVLKLFDAKMRYIFDANTHNVIKVERFIPFVAFDSSRRPSCLYGPFPNRSISEKKGQSPMY